MVLILLLLAIEAFCTDLKTIENLCPPDFPYAFAHGTRCCSSDGGYYKFDFSGGCFKRGEWFCPGSPIECPYDDQARCNDYISPCFDFSNTFMSVYGYDFPDDRYNGEYSANLYDIDFDDYENSEFLGDDDYGYNLKPSQEAIWINNRPVFIKKDDNETISEFCIWWDENWKMGLCEDLGTSTFYAIMDSDEFCPYSRCCINEEHQFCQSNDDGARTKTGGLWRTQTGALISGYFRNFEERNDDYDYHNYAFASLAVKPKSITATGLVSYTLQNGVYQETCRWKYLRRFRQWRCIIN